MNSLDLITIKKTLKDYIDNQDVPREALRLILKEVLEEVSKEAYTEAMNDLNKLSAKENEDACTKANTESSTD